MILGFDFGTKKIGVAVGQLVTKTASPLKTIKAQSGEPDWNALNSIINEYQPNAFVVGLPLNLDGSESVTSEKARAFGEQLNQKFNIEVHYINEHLTSFVARRMAKESKNKKGPSVDALAAALILQAWLQGEEHVG